MIIIWYLSGCCNFTVMAPPAVSVNASSCASELKRGSATQTHVNQSHRTVLVGHVPILIRWYKRQ